MPLMRTQIVLPRSRQSCSSSAAMTFVSRLLLVRRRDRVLEIEEDVVGLALERLAETSPAASPAPPARCAAAADAPARSACDSSARAGGPSPWRRRPGCAACASGALRVSERRGGAAPVLLRRRDAAARGHLDADIAHRHLGAGDAAEQHQLVQVAQVADAEELAGHPGQTGAERQVVAAVGHVDHFGAVDAGRHQDGAHRIRVPFGRPRAELEAPRLDRRAGALGQPVVPREHVVEPLFEEDRERLAQTVEHRQRRRVGK